MALNDVIGRLAAHLDLETASFERGSARTKREVTGLERHITRAGTVIKGAFVGMFGALAVDQLLQVAKAGLDYASSLGEVATQLGVTTKELQEYRYAASQAGIETGEMDQALSQLTRRLGDAAQGAKAPLAAFDRLGISVRDTNGQVLAAGDAIPLIAEGLQKIASPAERAAILVDLFGKSGQKLAPLLEGGAAGVNNLRDAAHKLGIVLSEEEIQSADETADKLSAMKQVLEAKIAGFVARNAKEIEHLADQLFRLAEAALKAAAEFGRWINGPGGSAARAQNAMIQTPGATGAVFEVRRKVEAPSTTRQVELTNGLGQSFFGTKKIRLPKGGHGGGRAPIGSPDRVNAVGGSAFGAFDWSRFTPGADGDFMRVAKAANDMVRPLSLSDTMLTRMAMTSGVRLVRNFVDAARELEATAAAAQSILDRLYPEEARRREYLQDLAILNQRYRDGGISAERLADAQARLTQEFIVGSPAAAAIVKGFDRYKGAAEDATRSAEVTRVQVAKSFADMSMDVVGSLNQLANSIKGGGFFDILSSLAGLGLTLGQSGAFGSKIQANLNAVPRYATGTDFHPGGLALVGERGPELVSMPRGSRVTPNNELGGMGGIATIVPSKYFDVVVDGRIYRAGPGIAQAGSASAQSALLRSAERNLA